MSPRPETPNSSGASSVVALVRTPHEFAGPSLSVKLSGDAKRLSPLNQLVRQWPDFFFPFPFPMPTRLFGVVDQKKTSWHASPAHSSFARCFHPLGPTAHDLECGKLRRQVSSLFNKPFPGCLNGSRCAGPGVGNIGKVRTKPTLEGQEITPPLQIGHECRISSNQHQQLRNPGLTFASPYAAAHWFRRLRMVPLA